MEVNDRKNKVIGLVGTVLLHGVLLLVLWLLFIRTTQNQEESGVPVMFGNEMLAQGKADPYTMTKVDVQPVKTEVEPVPEPEIPTPPVDTRQDLMTQEDEETVAVKPEEKKQPKKEPVKKETPKKETPKKEQPVKAETPKKEPVEEPKPAEKTEAEKRAEAEQAAAQAAAKNIAGAFGKGTSMGSKGTAEQGEGIQGSPTGNSSEGQASGEGGYGTFDLGGRSLGEGGLPVPVYNVQDEGRVVVTITVNPSGYVIATSINKRTNTVNAALRKAAEDAARKARFNTVSGVNNQTGTITYYFKLK